MKQTSVQDRRKFDEIFKREAVLNWLHSGTHCVCLRDVLIHFIMKFNLLTKRPAGAVVVVALFALAARVNAADYQVLVSNEKAGNLTVINGDDFKVVATIPVGKRPRGIHASPDGKIIYVALSGTPIEPPPELDANGNPIFQKDDDDEANVKADKAADGIGIVDVAREKFLRKIPAGSDPEQFCVSADGKRLYISNEDTGTATVLDAETGKNITFIPVSREPEGAGVSPDGKFFYITCETAGDVFAIDAQTLQIIGHIQVHPRPRSVAFLPDGSRAFVPSESVGELNVIDVPNQKLLQVIPLPPPSRPQSVLVGPEGKKVYVSTGRAGTIVVVEAHTCQVVNTIKVGARPWGIAISPDGKYIFSANGPSDDVSVVDLAGEKEVTRIKSPGSPWGVEVVAEK